MHRWMAGWFAEGWKDGRIQRINEWIDEDIEAGSCSHAGTTSSMLPKPMTERICVDVYGAAVSRPHGQGAKPESPTQKR